MRWRIQGTLASSGLYHPVFKRKSGASFLKFLQDPTHCLHFLSGAAIFARAAHAEAGLSSLPRKSGILLCWQLKSWLCHTREG